MSKDELDIEAAENRRLNEVFWSEVNFDEEAQGEGKPSRMRVWGCVQEADTVNRNKRIYPREVMEDTIKDLQRRVGEKRVFGEVDHPLFKGQLRDTSHLVTKVWWDEENPKRVMAEMLVLNTPAGEIVKEIIRAGGRPGFSSRGSGKTTPTDLKGHGKVEKIEPGFRFESFDFVIDPSVRPAKITKIMESLNIPWEDDAEEEKMTLDELKAKHPELLAEAVDGMVAEKARQMQADFDSKLKAETDKAAAEAKAALEKETADKAKDEEIDRLKGRAAELEAELNQKDADLAKHLETIEGFVSLLTKGEYIKTAHQAVQDDESKAKDAKIAELEKVLDETKAALAKAEAEMREAKASAAKKDEEAEQERVKAFIAQRLAGHRFAAVIAARIEGAKTLKEAEERLADLTAFMKTVEEGLVPPAGTAPVVEGGKGREAAVDESNKPDAEAERSFKERIQARAGIRK